MHCSECILLCTYTYVYIYKLQVKIETFNEREIYKQILFSTDPNTSWTVIIVRDELYEKISNFENVSQIYGGIREIYIVRIAVQYYVTIIAYILCYMLHVQRSALNGWMHPMEEVHVHRALRCTIFVSFCRILVFPRETDEIVIAFSTDIRDKVAPAKFLLTLDDIYLTCPSLHVCNMCACVCQHSFQRFHTRTHIL